MTTDLADRYGAPARWRRPVTITLAVALAVVGLGWLGWTAWFHSTPEATSELVTFEVTSDYEVAARLDVQLDDGVDASCRLRALAEDKTAVGELEFSPSQASTRWSSAPSGGPRAWRSSAAPRPASRARADVGLRFRPRLANLIVLPVRVRWPMSVAAPTPIGRMTPTDPVRGR